MIQAIRVATLVIALAATTSVGAEVGISRIAADEKGLTISASAPTGVELVLNELHPFQRYEPEASDRLAPMRVRIDGTGRIRVPRFDGARDRLYSKFQLTDAKTLRSFGAPCYVTDLTDLPARTFDFPWPKSIKGLQVQMVDDAIALGAKYAGINVTIPSVIDRSGANPSETWDVDGAKLPINMAYIRQLDASFKRLTDAGINVTAILNNSVPTKPDPANPFIHPRTDLAKAPFHLGAINVTDVRGIRYYRGVIEYLANRYSLPGAPHGWVTGYVVGNEVQAHWEWYNIGKMPLSEFVEHYGIALRITDLALRRFHAKLRTYVSLEHHWNAPIRDDPMTAFRGKDFLDALNAWAKPGGDFPWHVAFHPYPENLFEPRTWLDKQVALSFDTPKITFKNIEVLPAFLAQQRFGHEGRPRRIILSEQGFHTPDGPDGEKIQAAAYAYAYYKLSHTPSIDAFILHRHVDHKREGGLKLGLWTWKEKVGLADPDRKKLSYEVFRLADTDQWEKAFAFAKPVIGITDWKQILPVPAERIEKTPDLTPVLTVIADGKSEYQIVVPDEPRPVHEYASKELQGFLAEMSGVTLPIVREGQADAKRPALLIGQTKRRDRTLCKLGPDGVSISFAGRDVLLRGFKDRGDLYSVYVLLERYLGVRFLARDCTVVPKRKLVTLPAKGYAHTPPYMYRETLYFDSFPKQIAARQRLNGPTTKCDASVGGKIAFHPYVHSFCKLVPPEKYFKDHPEYFSLVGGKRVGKHIHSQLCLTNPDVLKIATAQVLKWIGEHPDVPIIDVSQNDGNGPCECDRCMAIVKEEGSQHGPILRFVNAIADVVAAKHPDKWVETLAYAYATKPPAKTRPRDNVIIRLCHAGCFFHGFEACGLGANLASYVDQWSKLTRRIFIWHYTTNFAHYLAPCQNLAGLAMDLKFYAGHGVNGVMVQGDYQSPGGELAELRQYLASQLMWDPGRDPGMIRLEFCNGYYGAAANEVLAFLALMDRVAKKADIHAFAAWDPKDTVTPAFLAEGLQTLTRARARAKTPEVANRVARLLLPLWYMQLTHPDRYGLGATDASRTLGDFKSVVEANKITHVREGGPNLSGWLAQMQAKFGKLADAIVYDLYLNMGQAKRVNCMDWRGEVVKDGDKTRLSIFQHPPAAGHGDATYEIPLPVAKSGERLVLRFATAFTGPTANGVRFEILVDDARAWSATQKTSPPIEREVDLTRHAGKTIRLTLRVDALADTAHDWANWVRPQIVRQSEPRP